LCSRNDGGYVGQVADVKRRLGIEEELRLGIPASAVQAHGIHAHECVSDRASLADHQLSNEPALRQLHGKITDQRVKFGVQRRGPFLARFVPGPLRFVERTQIIEAVTKVISLLRASAHFALTSHKAGTTSIVSSCP